MGLGLLSLCLADILGMQLLIVVLLGTGNVSTLEWPPRPSYEMSKGLLSKDSIFIDSFLWNILCFVLTVVVFSFMNFFVAFFIEVR